jgi:hypothetical protein
MANSVLTSFGTATGCNSGTQTPILGLNIAGQSAPVIYCIGTTTDPWLGKNMIYRWGPALNSDGSYGSWPTNPQPLVDLIAEAPQSSTCPTTPSAWTRIPSGTPKGFFVCIDPKNKMIELHLSASALGINTSKAQTTQWINPNTSSRLGGMATYEIVTQTFVRAPSDASVSVSPSTLTAGTGGNVTFTFRRAGDTSNAITLNYTPTYTPSGINSKFTGLGSSVSMAAGESSKTLVVTANNTVASGNSLTVSVTSGTGYTISGTSSATVTVP